MTSPGYDTLFALLRDADSEAIPGATADRLVDTALEDEGRATLLTLVNRPGLTNASRLAVIDALRDTIQGEDIPVLARAVVRMHPSVVTAAIGLLAGSGSAAALFAVRKPLRRGEPEIDDACDRAAARLTMSVQAQRYIRRDGIPPADFPTRELAYGAAAAAPAALADFRSGATDHRFEAQLGDGIVALLEELTDQAKTGTLNDFDSRLRDELHEAVVLSGVPAEPNQQDRSMDNLFRRRDLGDVRELAPHLPELAVARYASRALTRANRRSERTDRAALALDMLAGAEPGTRAQLHGVLVECLEESAHSLVAGAVAALAVDAERLTPADRQRVIRQFGTLHPAEQKALSPRLRGLAASAEEELDVESFLRWVDGAEASERTERLRALKTRWDTTAVSCEHATLFVSTLARGINRLPQGEHHGWSRDLVEGALSWMHRQGTQIVEPSRALLAWPGFAQVVLDDLDVPLSLLRADQARGLLIEILRQATEPVAVVAAIAQGDASQDASGRVLIPVLEEAIERDLHIADAAFQVTGPGAQRRLLQVALITAQHTKERIETAGQSTQDAADAAATEHGAAVLDALNQAESMSEGNDAIETHFESVRRAVESVLTSADTNELPVGVISWRSETAARFPEAVEAPGGGRTPLAFSAAAPAEAVRRILAELDQRVHSARVVTAEERTHLRQDLLACIDYIVETGLVEASSGAVLGGRPALGQLVWARWAELRPAPSGDLVEVLSMPVEPRDRQQALLKADALAGQTSPDSSAEVVEAIATEALPSAWSLVTAGLSNRLRQAESLEKEAKTRGVEVMERVAERLDPPLRAIEGLMVGYFRLRRRLSDAGWRPIEELLGKELRYDELDPNLHEIDGSAEAERFVVRSMGVRVRGRPIRRAVVEPLNS